MGTIYTLKEIISTLEFSELQNLDSQASALKIPLRLWESSIVKNLRTDIQ